LKISINCTDAMPVHEYQTLVDLMGKCETARSKERLKLTGKGKKKESGSFAETKGYRMLS
jgi:hypothetical protein